MVNRLKAIERFRLALFNRLTKVDQHGGDIREEIEIRSNRLPRRCLQ